MTPCQLNWRQKFSAKTRIFRTAFIPPQNGAQIAIARRYAVAASHKSCGGYSLAGFRSPKRTLPAPKSGASLVFGKHIDTMSLMTYRHFP
jgi:hypothetical protein